MLNCLVFVVTGPHDMIPEQLNETSITVELNLDGPCISLIARWVYKLVVEAKSVKLFALHGS